MQGYFPKIFISNLISAISSLCPDICVCLYFIHAFMYTKKQVFDLYSFSVKKRIYVLLQQKTMQTQKMFYEYFSFLPFSLCFLLSMYLYNQSKSLISICRSVVLMHQKYAENIDRYCCNHCNLTVFFAKLSVSLYLPLALCLSCISQSTVSLSLSVCPSLSFSKKPSSDLNLFNCSELFWFIFVFSFLCFVSKCCYTVMCRNKMLCITQKDRQEQRNNHCFFCKQRNCGYQPLCP